jgi:hypothetical protein
LSDLQEDAQRGIPIGLSEPKIWERKREEGKYERKKEEKGERERKKGKWKLKR